MTLGAASKRLAAHLRLAAETYSVAFLGDGLRRETGRAGRLRVFESARRRERLADDATVLLVLDDPKLAGCAIPSRTISPRTRTTLIEVTERRRFAVDQPIEPQSVGGDRNDNRRVGQPVFDGRWKRRPYGIVSADLDGLDRASTARTVEGHHARPPCAVGTHAALSCRAISPKLFPFVRSARMRETTSAKIALLRPRGAGGRRWAAAVRRRSRSRRSSSSAGISLAPQGISIVSTSGRTRRMNVERPMPSASAACVRE